MPNATDDRGARSRSDEKYRHMLTPATIRGLERQNDRLRDNRGDIGVGVQRDQKVTLTP
ncbi:hypothetical protein LRC484719_25140 [Mycobacterium riyadhense]